MVQEQATCEMTAEQRKDFCAALLLLRYLGHRVSKQNAVSNRCMRLSMVAAMRSLELAKALGIGQEYLQFALAHPILSIECKELED